MSERSLREVVESAFKQVHEGRSTDDVIIDDALNSRFLLECQRISCHASSAELNHALLNLRKTSRLGAVTTVRHNHNHEAYVHAAEIAARHTEDHFGATIDRIMCDPEKRVHFDKLARGLVPDVSLYLLRKAALGLRKQRRLKPELANCLSGGSTVVSHHSAQAILDNDTLVPDGPGVYVFFDHTGYLYIGEAQNMRVRIKKHLDHSDRKALAQYLWENGYKDLQIELHSFDKASDARLKRYRRAYESDLISSRSPRFNIR